MFEMLGVCRCSVCMVIAVRAAGMFVLPWAAAIIAFVGLLRHITFTDAEKETKCCSDSAQHKGCGCWRPDDIRLSCKGGIIESQIQRKCVKS